MVKIHIIDLTDQISKYKGIVNEIKTAVTDINFYLKFRVVNKI